MFEGRKSTAHTATGSITSAAITRVRRPLGAPVVLNAKAP